MENTTFENNVGNTIDKLQKDVDMDKYVSEFSEDTKISLYNLREKSLMVPALKCKWIGYYKNEKENMSKIRKKKDVIKKNSFKGASSSMLNMKNEEIFTKNDPKMQLLSILEEQTKKRIDYLEKVLNVMDNIGFDIKNMVDVLKLENGK